MRPAAWTVAGLLLLAAVGLTLWSAWRRAAAGTPGQFPIGAPRFAWPAEERVAPFRPGPEMGSDAARVAGGRDTKAVCATGNPCDGTPLAGAAPRG
jgi:hypothetical protein